MESPPRLKKNGSLLKKQYLYGVNVCAIEPSHNSCDLLNPSSLVYIELYITLFKSVDKY